MKKITLGIAALLTVFTLSAQKKNFENNAHNSLNKNDLSTLGTTGTNDIVVDFPVGSANSGYGSLFAINSQDQGIVSLVRATNFEISTSTTIEAINIFNFQNGQTLENDLIQYEMYILPNTPNNLPDELSNSIYDFVGTTDPNSGYQLTKDGSAYTHHVDVEDGTLTLAAGSYWLVSLPILPAEQQSDITQQSATYWFVSDATATYPAATLGQNGWETIEPVDQDGNPTGEEVYFAFEMLDENEVLAVTNLDKDKFMYYNNNEILVLSSENAINTANIYDITGKKIVTQNHLNTTNANVNIANLQAGVYIAQVQVEGKTKTFKFVKK